MTNFARLIARFRRDDSGATAIEYGLIAALLSLAIIAALPTVGSSIGSTFNTIGTTLTTANGG
jgi:pilus assembly protein Flp/PilA